MMPRFGFRRRLACPFHVGGSSSPAHRPLRFQSEINALRKPRIEAQGLLIEHVQQSHLGFAGVHLSNNNVPDN